MKFLYRKFLNQSWHHANSYINISVQDLRERYIDIEITSCDEGIVKFYLSGDEGNKEANLSFVREFIEKLKNVKTYLTKYKSSKESLPKREYQRAFLPVVENIAVEGDFSHDSYIITHCSKNDDSMLIEICAEKREYRSGSIVLHEERLNEAKYYDNAFYKVTKLLQGFIELEKFLEGKCTLYVFPEIKKVLCKKKEKIIINNKF